MKYFKIKFGVSSFHTKMNFYLIFRHIYLLCLFLIYLLTQHTACSIIEHSFHFFFSLLNNNNDPIPNGNETQWEEDEEKSAWNLNKSKSEIIFIDSMNWETHSWIIGRPLCKWFPFHFNRAIFTVCVVCVGFFFDHFLPSTLVNIARQLHVSFNVKYSYYDPSKLRWWWLFKSNKTDRCTPYG